MNERRIKRLEAQIKARAAQVVGQEMADPRRGLITITRVEVDRELEHCKIYWSVLGNEKERMRNQQVLDHARLFVQHEIGAVLHTRTVPKVRFVFDESIAGALRVDEILAKLREERAARGELEGEGEAGGEAAAGDEPVE